MKIRRKQWFELHDLPWWPTSFRAFLTNVLILVWGFPWISLRWKGQRVVPSFASLSTRVLDRFFRKIETTRDDGSRVTQVVDLCSGAGGPWIEVHDSLGRTDLQVKLTDLYPPSSEHRSPEIEGRVEHVESPVDATMVSRDLPGVRTMFGCFHHFPPELLTLILEDCVEQEEPIAVIETCQRSWLQAIGAGLLMGPLAFASPILCFRRTSWSSILLTYVIPILPLLVCFDGMMSCLRGYRPEEMRALVDQVPGSERFEWQVGEESFFGLFSLTYMTGHPTIKPAMGDSLIEVDSLTAVPA